VISPYGGGAGSSKHGIKVKRTGGTWSEKYQLGNSIADWDIAPPDEYFNELFRVSKNQIIWGGNYFSLPPTQCFIIWDKRLPELFSMAMAEYAWCSIQGNAKIFRLPPWGDGGNTSKNAEKRFHPTQKPVKLYRWLLANYAKPGDKILDTHVGSGSSLIACHEAGYEYIGFEIDGRYFGAAQERIRGCMAQVKLGDLPGHENITLL